MPTTIADKLKINGNPDGSAHERILTQDETTKEVGWIDKDTGLPFIPLAGTEPGSPVTGDIEIASDADQVIKIHSDNLKVEFAQDEDVLRLVNTQGTNNTGIELANGVGAYTVDADGTGSTNLNSESARFHSTNPDAVGYSGQEDYTANIGDLDYTQKKYVDDAIAAGVGTVTEVTGTDGVTVATGTTTPVIGLGDITPDSVSTAGTIFSSNGISSDSDITSEADIIAAGNVTGANLSGTNTGDDAVNVTSMNYADTRVQNNLSPSGTVAPSASAVNTALATVNASIATKQTYFERNMVTSSAVTGVVVKTLLISALIPANTTAVGSELIIDDMIQKVGTAGGVAVTINKHTSNTVSGSTPIALFNAAGGNLWIPMKRKFIVKTGNVLFGYNYTSSAINDDGTGNIAPDNTCTWDPTVDNYIIIAVTPSAAGDSFTSQSFTIKGIK